MSGPAAFQTAAVWNPTEGKPGRRCRLEKMKVTQCGSMVNLRSPLSAIQTVKNAGWCAVARAIVINPDYEVTPWEPNLNFYAEKRGLTQAKIDEELRMPVSRGIRSSSSIFTRRPKQSNQRSSAFPPQAFEGLSVT
jgi:hypothetical protein